MGCNFHMIQPWQKTQWETLQNAFLRQRLSHAYLFTGMPGLGKTDLAITFATYLLCDNKQRGACGQCRSCQWMRAKTHPDFLLIQPQEKNHAVKIDQIREINQRVSKTPQCGGYQVVVISPADSMPIAAANALLKTLEEPVGQVIFFLIHDQQHILPATIPSRCQTIYFSNQEKMKT